MKQLILISFTILPIFVLGQKYQYFSKTEVKQDIDYVFEKLCHIHPILLDDTKLARYQDQQQQIKANLKDSLTQNEVYLLLAPVLASLNDGHTGMMAPVKQRINYNKAGGKAFPFMIHIADSSIFIRNYCGDDTTFCQGGEQILKINGIDAKSILRNMSALISGEAISLKEKEMSRQFRLLLWMLYGFEADYKLDIKDKSGAVKTLKVNGINSETFRKYMSQRPSSSKPKTKYKLEIDSIQKSAILTLGSFADLDGFCVFADSAFRKLEKQHIKHLILDIRNNSGGRSIVVDSLMNYLTDKPYTQYKRIETRISLELQERYRSHYPERSKWLESCAIDSLTITKPEKEKSANKKYRFEGQLYLLCNNASYSAAATFAGVFKALNLGSIIGETSGGTIAYYGDFWFLKTPHTSLQFYISPKRFIQHGGDQYQSGVEPHYQVSDQNKDIVDFTKQLIKKQKI